MLPSTINIFEKAAKKAGRILARDFGEIENLQIKSKSIGDFVTSADLKVEQSLLETLKYYYPNANFITEESGSIKGEGETIVIDPIDGTSNFIHGIPHVAIVIGKIVNEQITDGIIYNPILNEFYWASHGKGAWCNNRRIRVSKRQDLNECLIATGAPFGKRIYSEYYKELENTLGVQCKLLDISGTVSESTMSSDASKTVLIFFIGGYTLAEVAAFRHLQTSLGYHFVICSTCNITGRTLINSILECDNL